MQHPGRKAVHRHKVDLCAEKLSSKGGHSAIWNALAIAAFLFLTMMVQVPAAHAQANVQGTWQTLPTTMPINPVHTALMANGKILVVSGSGNSPAETTFSAGIYDPATDTITTQQIGWDMFCNGMVLLPDGRPFIMGGNLQYDPFHGWQRTAAYDPATGKFTDLEDMAHGRWYPTSTVLGDGRVMTFSGLDENGATDSQVEIYKVGVGWAAPQMAPWTPPLYPRMHLLPNGKVFYSGLTTQSRTFDPATNLWSDVIATTNYGGSRTYGSSVLLPLTPANSYKPKVMIFGGGNPSTATTEIIDMSAASPAWVYGPPMAKPRIEMNATLLPNGKLLTVGGSLNDEDVSNASLAADLYDSTTNTMASAGSNTVPRLYHSVALLLPDGTVWVAGGNPQRGTYETSMEIYSPPYLFKADGTPATRPTITSVTPGVIGYGASFQIQTPDAANIASVVVMKNGAVTHAFDMDQRMVGLTFTKGSGVLDLVAPPNGNIAPPGYYMIFLLNSAGVPSVAKFVQISTAASGEPPTGTITSPATDNISLNSGQSLSFSGTGVASGGNTITGYSWSFRGASPVTSAQQSAGAITFTEIGTYTAVFTVTDSAGLTDPSPKTRTITVLPTLPAPTLTGVTPNAGTQGLTSVNVTLTGSNFVSPPVCNFGLSVDVNSCILMSATQVKANIDILANAPTGTRDVTVTNPDGQIAKLVNGFTVNAGTVATAPMLTAVTPNSEFLGTSNATVILTGTNFQPSPTCDFDVDFGGTISTCTYDSPTQITVNLTIGTNAQVGGHNVIVTNADGQSATLINGFTVTENLGNTVKLGAGFTLGAMVLNGNASLAGNILRLTDSQLNEASSAWYATRVNVQDFVSDFTFQITPGTTADGFTFTLQGNSTAALGQFGGQLGYGAISPGGPGGIGQSVAVKFDLYSNVGEGIDSVGLYTNAADPTIPSIDMSGTGIDLHSGDIFAVHLTYDGTSLAMTITDTVSNATLTHSWPIDIPTTVGGRTAYAGFTAGTGGLIATQDILSWTLGPLAPAVAIAPASPLTFPDTTTDMTSAPITVTVTNGGTSDLHISGVTTSGTNPGDFLVASNTCTTAVAPTASCTIGVTFKPSGTGARQANLSIADDAAGSPQTLTLTGNGTAQAAPAVTINPSGTVTFPSITQGTTSAQISVTVTNSGNASLNITTVTLAGANASDFAIASSTCGSATLAANGTCTVAVTFTPSAVGVRQAALQVADNATGSPQSVGLSGTGTAPATPGVTITPAGSLTFPNTTQNTTSAASVLTLSNSGTGALIISSIAIAGVNAGDFALAAGTTCAASGAGATIAASSSCAIALTFTPSATGVRQATLQITDNASGSPQSVGLSGSGTAPAVPVVKFLPPGALSFPNTTQNTTSAASVFTVENTGTAPLNISAIAISGVNAGDFALAAGTTCAASGAGATVAAGSSCAIALTFTPSATGVRQGTLQITDNASGSPHSVALSGTGTAPTPTNPAVTITPASVSIAATQGTTSAMTNVVVTNSGNAPLHISGVTYGGANVAEFVNPGNPCAAVIAPNGSCTISVGFAPMAASGSASENISITSDAANSPQIVTVTGTASPAFALTSAATALMASVTAGQTATYNLQLMPGAGYSGNISMACSGAPSHSTCAVTPNPVALTSGNAANFTVNIATTASSFLVPNSARRPISIPPMPAPNFLGWTLAFSIVVMATLYQRGDRRRFGFAFTSRQFAYSGFAIVILMAYGLAGCATGGNSTASPPPTQSGTPQGTYTITLTPAASSMTGQPLQTAALAIHLTLTVK